MTDTMRKMTMNGAAISDEQLRISLVLVFESTGSEGVEEFAAAHGLDAGRCRELLEAELSGSEPQPAC